jgi:hypothetical protein
MYDSALHVVVRVPDDVDELLRYYLYREVLGNLMAHYGIPQKFINIIRNSYNNMQCRVIHEGKLTESFDVKAACKLVSFILIGCLLLALIFITLVLL